MAKLGRFQRISPAEWLFQEHGDVRRARQQAERYQAQNGSIHGAERSVEEFVRQWMIQELIGTYGYPADWIDGRRLVIEHPIAIGSRFGQADIALLQPDGRPFLLVEIKSHSISDSAYRDALGQLESYLSATHSATYGVLTDGHRTTVIHKRASRRGFQVQGDFPGYTRALLTRLTARGTLRTHRQPLRVSIVDQLDEIVPDEPDEELVSVYTPHSTREYVVALRQVAARMSDLQRAFLIEHYRSPDRTATATELAHAVGASTFQTTNTQYGKLAGMVIAALDIPPGSLGANLSVLMTFVPPQHSPSRQWLLIMRPEVARALEQLGWV